MFFKNKNLSKGGPLGLVFLSCQPHCGPWRKPTHDIQAWASATDGDTYNSCRLSVLNGIKKYKIALLELRDHNFHLIKKIKKGLPHIKLIGVAEGSLHSPDNDYGLKKRLGYFDAYEGVDALGYLLEDSASYFKHVTSKPVFWLGVPFPTEWSKAFVLPPETKEPIIEMSNGFGSQKGGTTNFFLLRAIQKEHSNIKGRSYSRNKRLDESIAKNFGVNIEFLPPLDWQGYFIRHTKAYIALNLDYRWSWNRYSLDCAAAGIPCIGTSHTTTHKLLFPKLCVEPFDIEHARLLATKLLKDKSFYNECRNHALEKVETFSFKSSAVRLKNFLAEQKWI